MEEATPCEVAAAKLQGLFKGVELSDKDKAKMMAAIKALTEDPKMVEDTDPDVSQ